MIVADPTAEFIDVDRIEAIAARLDLREPNTVALQTVAMAIAQHYEIDREPPPFEGVVDIATGVGKTYVLAATIEHLAGEGVRDFAVITPGRTILNKTVDNFTPGHPKSLLRGMETEPVVITSENFNTPAMRAIMDDRSIVKLYVFTVQALVKPKTKQGRKTHEFQEQLGEAFYAHMQGVDDLTVFADEHHAYYGPAFSDAVRDLAPRVLIGLTATPHKKTPPDQIIYRYPLAAAIADKLVKKPVLVGRKDDLSDARTKLLDGVRLLDLKGQAVNRWCADSGAQPVLPVMLVIAPSIVEADEIESIIADPSFFGGQYQGKVLTVHSKQPDDALAQLAELEEPENPYRIVISVGMLKEGWDVKNVYVIASLRASVSDLLTEQTLGRGLRLPFGAYTGVEFLDTLEVLGHERYEELLRRANVLQEQFIDYRTQIVLRRNAVGQVVPAIEQTPVSASIFPESLDELTESTEPGDVSEAAGTPPTPAPTLTIRNTEEATDQAERQVTGLSVVLAPRDVSPALRVPRLRMTTIKSPFKLADITDLEPFRQLGKRLAADPSGRLRRVAVGARIVVGEDGLRHTELVTEAAQGDIVSPASLLSFEELRDQLIDSALHAPIVPARATEYQPATWIVDAFLDGLGAGAAKVLSGYLYRAAKRLTDLVTTEQRKYAAKPTFDEVVELVGFNGLRTGRAETSRDRYGAFKRNVGYLGYAKSLYTQVWFDSSTERDVANIIEDDDEVIHWVRLQINDLPILWDQRREYNPDLIAVDRDGTHWLIEVKMDKEMASADVQGKREAARRWANHVSADEKVSVRWRYLLVSETDVKTATGSWEAIKSLGV